eukprot:Seg97.8 transcript_id=Seg97.8/GoldUCD/mRNA.D3Y31 product="Dehydrodolichyl diphosphate synthase complex subunit Nus1" protein_id=Seg97.8/GoldUCD/D3Y31
MGKFIILEYCPVLIFRLVLYSIHLIISFATGLKRFLTYLKRCYVAANMGLSNLQRCTKNDIDVVQCFAREVTKLPKHLSIILMNYEDTCIEDLSNIAVWSFAVGVQYVSFYEKIGELHNIHAVLKKKIIQKLKMILGESYNSYSLVLKNSSTSYDNGYVHTKGICIQILSEEDGRQDLVGVANEISEDVNCGAISPSDIDAVMVGSQLRALKGLPDPDLILQFGKVLCLDGFIPWQIRLSEIISTENCKDISLQEFLRHIRRYSKCEQRFGK